MGSLIWGIVLLQKPKDGSRYTGWHFVGALFFLFLAFAFGACFFLLKALY